MPGTVPVVLDAGSIIAYLQGEPGGDIVRQLIDDGERPIYAHALNACEVHYHFARQEQVVTDVPPGMPRVINMAVSQDALATMATDGLLVRTDLDAGFCEDVAQLKAIWRRVSLADCCGLALTRRLKDEFFTTYRHELSSLQSANLTGIVFIR